MIASSIFINRLLIQVAPLINTILKSDELLTENQRKQEMLREDTKRQEAANLRLKAENRKRELEKEAMAVAHEDSMRKLTEHLVREFSSRAENLERQMENEKREVCCHTTLAKIYYIPYFFNTVAIF